MGKKDSAQRTKGNAKVSSSARSAQILGTNTGFIGFGTTTESGFVPLMQADDGVPTDFRLVLRKMQKKDITTKVKALQEFLDLASNSCEEDMVSVLPFWPAVYNKLAIDTDHRIRELTHTALKAVVTAVGKNLAPHLKSISGVWFLGQSDTNQLASEAALAAWQSAFPDPVKSGSAKQYCQEDILSLIEDNLIRATPQTLSDPKTTPVEEMESKYERTLCMSLLSYIKLLNVVNNIDPEKHCKLLEFPKFWKFSKHKSIQVRRSFMKVVSEVCEKVSTVLVKHAASAIPSVLTCLGDLDTGAIVWESSLQLLCIITEPWSYVNQQKAVFPGLWNVLSSAAGGKPRDIFPLVMPFLSKLEVDKMADPEKFLTRWFSSLQQGLDMLKEKKSSCDMDIVIKTMIECVFYLCNKTDLPANVKSGLVRDHLVAIVTQNTNHIGHEVASCLVDYLLFWNRNSSASNEGAQCNLLFWSSIQYYCVQEKTMEPVLMLHKALMKKSGEKKIIELNRIITIMWNHQIDTVKNGEQNEKPLAIDILKSVLENFEYKTDLFGSEEDFIKLYNESFLSLMSMLEYEECITSLTWSLSCIIKPESGLKVLNSFTESSRPVAVVKLVQKAVTSKPGNGLLANWLVSPEVQKVVIDSIELTVNQFKEGHIPKQEHIASLKLVLQSDVSLPEESQHKLITIITHNLHAHNNKVKLVEFLCDIVTLIAKAKNSVIIATSDGKDLIKEIFVMDALSTPDQVRPKLERCWRDLAKLDKELIHIMAIELRQCFGKELSMLELECVVNKATELAKLVNRQSNEEVNAFFTSLIPDVNEKFSEVVWYPIVFHQNLFYESCSERLEESLFQQTRAEAKDLINPNISFLIISTLSQLYNFSDIQLEEEKTVCEDERITIPDAVLQGCILDRLLQSTISIVYMQNMILDTNSSQDMKNLENKLTSTATCLFSKLSKRNLDQVEMKLFEKCKTDVLYTHGLSWLLGVTYQYSDWDLRLNRFLNPEDEDITADCNTLVTLLRLSSRFNIGSASLSSYIRLATGKLLSLQGLKTDEGTCLLWFICQTLSLGRPGSRLHIGSVADLTGEVEALLTMILEWKEENESELLYSSDVSLSPWSVVNRVCSVINLLNLAVNKFQDSISSNMWDLIMCSLVQWVASLEESKDSLCCRPGCLMFGISVGRLVTTVSKTLARSGVHPALSLSPVKGPVDGDEMSNCNWVASKLKDEWEEFFAEGIFTVLVPLYIKVCSGKEELYSCTLLCTSLGEALVHTPLPLLLQSELPPLYLVQDVDAVEIPDNITFILNHFGPKLSCSCRSFQVTAAHILSAVTKEIPSHVDMSGEAEECEIPRRFLEIMQQGELVLESVLAEFSISDPVPDIPTGTVAFSQSLGYLLCWRAVLCLLENSSDIVRPRYSQFLDNKEHISKLLGNVFKLLPQKGGELEVVFTPGNLDVATEASSWEISQLAGSCWVQVCRHLPAAARQWFSTLDKESQIVVEKITCNYVTPALWAKEIDILNSSEKSENLTLKVRESVREVVATYSIDEGSMELVVTLPSNYPLGALTVESARRVGVETGQWRKWMLQLTTFLTHQNGSIYEGLNLWKKNVDKRFEGVEECYICFYILHGSNHQLPKLACRTCKKKFHSACLYKWFSTSNNSTCPLCRNLF